MTKTKSKVEREDITRTAIDNKPSVSCFKLKSSSAKLLVPYMQVDPVPSPCKKSPPWHMNLGICANVDPAILSVSQID